MVIDINAIIRDLFNNIMRFLKVREVYPIVRRVNKTFNNHINSYSCDNVRIEGDRMNEFEDYVKKMLENKIMVFRLPKRVEFVDINFSEEKWKFVKTLNVREIEYYNCDLNNDFYVPKKITEFGVCWCRGNNFNEILSVLENERTTLKTLDITMINNDVNDDVLKKIFSFDLKMLRISIDYQAGCTPITITKDNLEQMVNLMNLRGLKLTGFIFDKSCNNLVCFKNHNILFLDLSFCNIGIEHVTNIVTPSTRILHLDSTSVDDKFIEQLSIYKSEHMLKLYELNISNTRITEKCFKHLNTLELSSLAMNHCRGIGTLADLNMPSLKELSLNYFCWNNNDIKHLIQPKLEILDISQNKKLTDVTLQNINENKLRKLKVLKMSGANVTKDGIIKYLSGMKLRTLVVFPASYDEEEFVKNEVLST